MEETHTTLMRMIEYSRENKHDIAHFLKVHSLAREIGLMEKLSCSDQYILEEAAIVHDIACPLCREKYGSAPGNLQEKESESLVRDFFADSGFSSEDLDRIVRIVCHHHTYTSVTDIAHQILLEADYLVNADESGFSAENIENFRSHVFKTASGIRLLRAMYFPENT